MQIDWDELLHSPVKHLGHENLTFRGHRECVRTGKLARSTTSSSKAAKDSSAAVNFKYARCLSIGKVDMLIGPYAEPVRMPNIRPLRTEVSLSIKNLHTSILSVAHIDQASRIRNDCMGQAKFSFARAAWAP